MKFSVVAAALAGASTVYGHTIFSAMYLNGVDQGLGVGKYIRGPRNNSPVKDVTSKDIICNVNNSPVPQTLEVSAGDQITMEWFHGTRNDDIIDKSHVGPVMVYIAPTASNGEGPVWVKLFDQGFTNDWATNYLIAAKGHVTITLPDLAPGEYLLRPEIIALHEGETDFTVNSARGAQFYMGCGQIKVVSSGSVPLSAGIDFQKDHKHDSPGILFDVYSKPGSSYTSPGGAVSSIAVAGQLGIAPVPAAGSKPTTAVASSSVAPTTSSTPSATVAPTAPAAQSTTTAEATSASVTTTTSCSEPLNPSSKMVTVTIKPTPTTTGPTVSVYPTTGTGSTAALKKYYQCGGINYTGSTVCEEGTTCKVQNPYYSQCL
ncbi:hypothetical protein FS749_004213 [Ceratobasidium sp. UAMH 11750]|nr:hypothetical protein FS749_004213 [Ceratobasidium sp. UAMH 11750]